VQYAEFTEFVRRALLELDQRKLARLDDDHRHAFFDHQFDPTHRPSMIFGELATQFMQLKEEDAAENRTGQKWLDKQHAQVDLLCEIVGKDTPIQKVDYDECMRVRSVVARMPAVFVITSGTRCARSVRPPTHCKPLEAGAKASSRQTATATSLTLIIKSSSWSR
jgi:hypothetical protein